MPHAKHQAPSATHDRKTRRITVISKVFGVSLVVVVVLVRSKLNFPTIHFSTPTICLFAARRLHRFAAPLAVLRGGQRALFPHLLSLALPRSHLASDKHSLVNLFIMTFVVVLAIASACGRISAYSSQLTIGVCFATLQVTFVAVCFAIVVFLFLLLYYFNYSLLTHASLRFYFICLAKFHLKLGWCKFFSTKTVWGQQSTFTRIFKFSMKLVQSFFFGESIKAQLQENFYTNSL